MRRSSSTTATSLAESVRLRLPGLRVASMPDMRCGDHMCQKFGELCLCRFSLQLERFAHVEHLDLRGAELHSMPQVWKMQGLRTIDVRDNPIQSLPAELATAPRLSAVIVGEPLRAASPAAVQHLLRLSPEMADEPP
jgi:hypothetical protein